MSGFEGRLYTIGKWHDRDNYECAFCPYATLGGEEAILKHISLMHAERHSPKSGDVLIANKRGRQVEAPIAPNWQALVAQALEEAEPEEGDNWGALIRSMNSDEVVKLVKDGKVTVERAIEFEQDGKNRVTLIEKLTDMSEEGEE